MMNRQQDNSSSRKTSRVSFHNSNGANSSTRETRSRSNDNADRTIEREQLPPNNRSNDNFEMVPFSRVSKRTLPPPITNYVKSICATLDLSHLADFVNLHQLAQNNGQSIDALNDIAKPLESRSHDAFQILIQQLNYQIQFAESALAKIHDLYAQFQKNSGQISKLAAKNDAYYHSVMDAYASSRGGQLPKELNDKMQVGLMEVKNGIERLSALPSLCLPYDFVNGLMPHKIMHTSERMNKFQKALHHDYQMELIDRFELLQANNVQRQPMLRVIDLMWPDQKCTICHNDLSKSSAFDKARIFACGHFVCDVCFCNFSISQYRCHICRIKVDKAIQLNDLTSNFFKFALHDIQYVQRHMDTRIDRAIDDWEARLEQLQRFLENPPPPPPRPSPIHSPLHSLFGDDNDNDNDTDTDTDYERESIMHGDNDYYDEYSEDTFRIEYTPPHIDE